MSFNHLAGAIRLEDGLACAEQPFCVKPNANAAAADASGVRSILHLRWKRVRVRATRMAALTPDDGSVIQHRNLAQRPS